MTPFQNHSNIIKEVKVELYDIYMSLSNVSFCTALQEIAKLLRAKLEGKRATIYTYNEWDDDFSLTAVADLPGSRMEQTSIIELHAPLITYMKTRPCTTIERYGQQSLIPLCEQGNTQGYIILDFREKQDNTEFDVLLRDIGEEIRKFMQRLNGMRFMLQEERKYEKLFNVTKNFHSTMELEEILKEIIDTLEDFYAEFDYYLHLSHDYSSVPHLPIKELSYDLNETARASTQAYLTGEHQLEDCHRSRQSYFYAPLKGKQGVYGVLEIVAPRFILFPEKDIELITMLANAAGNSLENARLYHQSRKIITDLQLINETSHKLNSNLRLSETITYMTERITYSFNAEEVGFILFDEQNGSSYQLLKGSTTFFDKEASYPLVNWLAMQLKNKSEPLFVGDVQSKFPKWSTNYQAIMAIPMIQRGELTGMAVVLHQTPYFFSFDTFKLLQSLIHHSTLAFANSMLREELEQLVRTDYLTKLHSRKYLDEAIQTHIDLEHEGSFIIMDIDNFKLVNDVYGHQTGDRILVQVSTIIKECVGSLGICARWGGEEIAVYLPFLTLEEGYELGQKIVGKIEADTNPSVTVSCGVSYWNPSVHLDGKHLFMRADKALYKAKEAGKNTVRVEHYDVTQKGN
ncbi:diguanylate cyclase domain-containing protein [Pontibacillus salicampi]|uniref:Diguanylate cyclase domain-containing protein n=1 Tax=Pontibacillus salicampi TaxID=1449801 RepID=A0ABV6LIT5_9BACI